MRVDDPSRCRLSVRDGETELAGPPDGLRSLAELLRDSAEPILVSVVGGFVAQEITSGPLLVSMRKGTTLHFSGGRDFLEIIWTALRGVAEEAENADDRGIRRHQHIEYYPGDEYRSPDTIPLIVMADWPEDGRSRS
jgi:hypothetical protein